MKGYRTILIGALMVVLPPLLTYLAGVNWADYVSPSTAAMISGLLMIVLRAVTNTPVGKSIIVLALASVLALEAVPSQAGDLANPAPGITAINKALTSSTPCVPGSCSGWFAGFGLLGDGTNADIIGSGINNSLFQSGGAIMASGGYQFWNAAWFAAIKLAAGYEFNSNNASTMTQGGSKFVGEELIHLGYNFFPNGPPALTVPGQSPTALTVPASLLASTTPFVSFGGLQRRGISEWVNGAGLQTVIASGWSSEVEYLYAPSQQGVPATNIVSLSLVKHF
jgi:hypothetical protein